MRTVFLQCHTTLLHTILLRTTYYCQLEVTFKMGFDDFVGTIKARQYSDISIYI